jgi:tRNA threonylcarbamoyladenosine biosynthesis protein TsaE
MQKIITKNEQETFNFGLKLGKKIKQRTIFALIGDLGAGKTKLIQGLAKGLGVKDRVNSPTFNILKIYKINKTRNTGKDTEIFCHIDAYRLKSERDLIALGVPELFEQPEVVTAIEWAEKVKKIWPKRTKIIKIKSLTENKREIKIK